MREIERERSKVLESKKIYNIIKKREGGVENERIEIRGEREKEKK